ncbi:MAG: pyruvate formate lyase family protein [Christensenellales bacterium]
MLDLNELGIERIRSLGNLDVIYAPFYRADVESGRLTKEDAYELFRYFFIRFRGKARGKSAVLHRRRFGRQKPCVRYDVPYAGRVPFAGDNQPKIHVRINKIDTSPLFETACDMILRGNGSVVLIVTKAWKRVTKNRNSALDFAKLSSHRVLRKRYRRIRGRAHLQQLDKHRKSGRIRDERRRRSAFGRNL